MKTVSAAEMQALDRRASEEFGIPSLLLMENAGRGAAELVFKGAKGGRVLIVCGKGNNGGDGFVAARHLFNRGLHVTILLAAQPSELKGDAALNYAITAKMQIPTVLLDQEIAAKRLAACVVGADFLVDALFGIGLRSAVSGVHETLIQTMNQSGRPILAMDIPSGLDTDDGSVHGIAVKASLTAAMGMAKHGHFRGKGPVYTGQLAVVDIGLPRQLLA